MTFTTQTQALRQALAAATAVIPNKPTLQILNNILVEVDTDTLALTACNTEQTITMRVQLSEPTDGQSGFLINARDLSAIVKAANFDTITFSIDTPSQINIGCGFSDYTLPILSTEEFPKQTLAGEPTATLTLQSNDIRLALAHVSYAIGTGDLRPQMKGVYFDLTEGAFNAVATDTRVLAKCSMTNTTSESVSAIIPSSAVSTLQGSFLSESTVTLTLYTNGAMFVCGGNKFTTVLISGRFPDYNRVIPQTHSVEAKFNRKDFMAAVGAASALADSIGLVRLNFTPAECVVSVSNADYQQKATSKCKCDFSGSELTINFNLRYLQSVLRSIDSEEVMLRMTDATRPGVFVSGNANNGADTVNLLMPMSGGSHS